MKAVILEIRGKEAAILCEDGQVIKIKKKEYQVGDTIEFTPEMEIRDHQILSIAHVRQYGTAAAAAALILAATGTYSYNTAFACSYVSMDVNPSIEYALNRKNCVIDVKALNTDAESIVETLKNNGIRKQPLADVLEKTTDVLTEQGYFADGEDHYILIGVSSDREKDMEKLKNAAESAFSDGDIHMFFEETSIADYKKAKTLGISSGEYQKIKEIKEKDAEGEAKDPQKDEQDIQIITQDDIEKYGKLEVREMLEVTGDIPGAEWKEQDPHGLEPPKETNEGNDSGETSDGKQSGFGKNDLEAGNVPKKQDDMKGPEDPGRQNVQAGSEQVSGERAKQESEKSWNSSVKESESRLSESVNSQETSEENGKETGETLDKKNQQPESALTEENKEQENQTAQPDHGTEANSQAEKNESTDEKMEKPSDAEHSEVNLSEETRNDDGGQKMGAGNGEIKE